MGRYCQTSPNPIPKGPRLRILILTNTYPPADISGVGTLVFELARQLDREGHEVTALVRESAENDHLALPTGGAKLLFPLWALWTFWRRLRHQNFDVIHLHESDGVLVGLLHWWARGLGFTLGQAQLVATLQVSYVRERRMVRTVFADGRPVSEPTRGELVFAYLRAPILSFLEKLTVGAADIVVAPSHETARELAEDYGAHSVTVIPNGVEVLAPSPRNPTTECRFLYSGRLRTRKAVAVLLEAWSLVIAEEPEVRLTVVGNGEQREALHRQHQRLNLGKTVTFTGGVPREEMLSLYHQADVFVLPSTYEGLPLAILEAMAASLPTVVTAVSGNPEAVSHGETGWVVPAESAEALAKAMLALVRDPAGRKAMGLVAARRLQEHFSIPVVSRQYLRLWTGRIVP